MKIRGTFSVMLASLAIGCTPTVYGRVVSDVRIANGYISVDRCLLKQRPYHGIAVSDCQTEDYYIGRAVVPVRSAKSEAP